MGPVWQVWAVGERPVGIDLSAIGLFHRMGLVRDRSALKVGKRSMKETVLLANLSVLTGYPECRIRELNGLRVFANLPHVPAIYPL